MKQVFIKGWDEKYSITDSGNVVKHYQIRNNGKKAYKDEHLVLIPVEPYGMQATLNKSDKMWRTYVHLLVIEAFGIEPPDDFHRYAPYHIDGDISNNKISNISFKIRTTGNPNFQPECKYNDKGNITFKKCANCGKWLPINRFITNKDSFRVFEQKIRKYKITYKNNCSGCLNTNNWNRIKTNPESKAKYKITAKKFGNKESTKEYHKEYSIRGRKKMDDWWVKVIIRGRGMNPDVFTPEMIETYKINLKIEREIFSVSTANHVATSHTGFPHNKTYMK